MTGLPQGWASAKIPDVLAELPTGNIIDQGWSPKCENFPSESEETWGALKTTAIQDGRFEPQHTKQLPDHLEPKPALEVREGDLLMTCAGPRVRCGVICRVERVRPKLFISGKMYRFRPNPQVVDGDYLLGALRSPDLQLAIDQIKTGGSESGLNLTQDRFKSLSLPLPPLPEQRRIVRKLDTLSARSTTARTHLTTLEKLVPRYKLAVLRSAFSGELTGKFRAETTTEPLSILLKRTPPPQQGRGGRQPTSEVIAGRGGISVNVPDVDLPEGWAWVHLLRVARQETGHTPSRSRPDWWDGDVCWMSIPDANLHHGRVIYDTIQKTNEDGLANSSARLLPAGTVVLSRTASVGYICILGKDMATSQDFATWTCTDALLPEYLMYALLSEGEDIKKFGEGSTHTTIYFPEIRAFHIKLAPIEEQHEIVRRIKAAFAKIDRLKAEAAKALKLLGHLDQRILAKAFAGDLVPQDPNDEPAETLLARIREARAAAPKARRGRKAKA